MSVPLPDTGDLPARGDDAVDGMTVFWILFGLSSAAALHPLGSAPGLPPEFASYVRVLPLSSVQDTVLLYAECVWVWWSRCVSLRDAARQTALARLGQKLPSDIKDDNWAQAFVRFFFLDIRPRVLANVVVVLAFVKLCGIHGNAMALAVSFIAATAAFASWLAMEIFLTAAFGIPQGITYYQQQDRPEASLSHQRLNRPRSTFSRQSSDLPTDVSGHQRPYLMILTSVLSVAQIAAFVASLVLSVVPTHSKPSTDMASNDTAISNTAAAVVNAVRLFLNKWFHFVTDSVCNTPDMFSMMKSSWVDMDGSGFGEVLAKIFLSVVLLFMIFVSLPLCAWGTWTMFLAPLIIVVFFLGAASLYGVAGAVVFPIRLFFTAVGYVARQVKTSSGLLLARTVLVCLIVLSFIFYNFLWNGTDIWKDRWTEKLPR